MSASSEGVSLVVLLPLAPSLPEAHHHQLLDVRREDLGEPAAL
jgi:hypothetical protein